MSGEFVRIIHDTVLESPLGAKQIAQAVGKPYSTLLREINPYDTGAKLGAETLVRVMQVTNNHSPLYHVAEQMGYSLTKKE